MNELIFKLKTRIRKSPQLFSLLKLFKKTLIDKPKEVKRNYLFKKNGKVAMLAFDKAAKEAGINYWLAFGTLLGAVREKGFIPHDFDIDVGMYFSEYSNMHEKVFNKYGFIKKRQFLIGGGEYGREETYSYKGVDIDIFYFKKEQDKIFCHLFTKSNINGVMDATLKENEFIIREISYPVGTIVKTDFLNKRFNIPENYHEILMLDYGKNYMTPDPDYKAGARENVRYLENIEGICREGQS